MPSTTPNDAAIERRKGARHPSLVPGNVLQHLIDGGTTANFMEQIALDLSALLRVHYPELAVKDNERLRNPKLATRMRAAASLLLFEFGHSWIDTAAFHRSDTIRAWAALAVSLIPDLSLAGRLEQLLRFADDAHFGVREWAWIGLRPHVVFEPCLAVRILESWTGNPSPNVRRFASEATRPVGVWSAHIPFLKTNPEVATELLTALRLDNSTYVQDSVGNWLNDAARVRPDWVRAICADWERQSPPSPRRLIRRARRNLAD